jgi:hypothetical protein
MDAKKLMTFLEKFPNAVEIVPVEEILLDSARSGGEAHGYLKLAAPDGMVKNIKGDPARRDTYLLVHIPNDIIRREESPIILPGL